MACMKKITPAIYRNVNSKNKILLNNLCRRYVKKSAKFLDGAVDPEVNFHSKLADNWWDNKNLIALNEVRVPIISNGIGYTGLIKSSNLNIHSCLKGINILDVGCGGGILSEALARLGGNVVGIDPSNKLIEVAHKHAKQDARLEKCLKYEVSTIHDFCKFNVNKFDAVVVSEVIEHIVDKEIFLKNCLVCLRSQGSIFITTPNKTIFSKILIVTLAEKIGMVPVGTHDYNKFITPEECKKLLQQLGCTIREVQGMKFNPLTGKFSLSYYNILMYAVHAQKL